MSESDILKLLPVAGPSSMSELFIEKESLDVIALMLKNVSLNIFSSSSYLPSDYGNYSSSVLWNTFETSGNGGGGEAKTQAQIKSEVEAGGQFFINFFYFFIAISVLLILNKILTKSKPVSAVLETIILWCFALVCSPLILVIIIPCLIARIGVYFYIKVKYSGKVKMATPVDSTWGFETYANTSTCPGLYIIEGKCDFKRIQNRFGSLLDLKENCGELTFLKMRSKLLQVFGFVCWERDDEFHVSNHIKLLPSSVASESGGGEYKVLNEAEVFQALSNLQDMPLSETGLSPWDVHVVPKYEDDNHYAMIFRIHHSIMDGVSTGNALYYLADHHFEFSIDPLKPFKKISDAKKFLGVILCITQLPQVLLRNLYAASTEQNAFHGKELIGPKKFVWSRPINMDAVKAIRDHSGTSTFAVLISCLGGSMRNLYLKNGLNVPNVIHAAPPVAMVPYPDRRPRNKFTLMTYPLSIGLKSAEDRLKAALEAVKTVAAGTEVLTCYYLINMLGLLPVPLLRPLGALPHTTTILSNIPGPKELVHLFGGHTLVDVGAFVPLKNKFGIGAALMSYAGKIRVTFVADKAAISEQSDVEYLRTEFENQICELAQIYGGLDKNSVFL